MKLTDSFKDIITFEGQQIKVKLSFDVVLRAFELLEDDYFSDAEKWEMLAEMFVADPADIRGLRLSEKVTFANAVFDYLIAERTEKPAENSDEIEDYSYSDEPYYDFTQDADYIYASFLFDYNIDLIEQQGKLHWKKFKALLNGLSEKTKFREVVNIRMRELPKDKEERRRLEKLKRLYALKEKPQNEARIKKKVEELDRKMNDLAAALRNKGGR